MDLVEVSLILQTKGGFRELYEQGVIQKLLPELDGIEQYLHSPKYHPEGNLLEHYCLAFDTLAKLMKDYVIDEHTTNVVVWSLLFHDIGKPDCAKLNEEENFHSFIKHESRGGDIFAMLYADMMKDYSPTKIEWIIRQHTNYWNIKKHGKSLAMANHEAFELLSLVCQADKMGFDHETLPSNDLRLEHFAEVVAKGAGH
ncbi:uncharacterized protein METZ01_LOCUS174407 [marine metagenome]|uniref:HD domain-containing protein n=1 Tax=marine metagenome TaxID=408172 RepID=A0A382C8F8_9ZZZZ